MEYYGAPNQTFVPKEIDLIICNFGLRVPRVIFNYLEFTILKSEIIFAYLGFPCF